MLLLQACAGLHAPACAPRAFRRNGVARTVASPAMLEFDMNTVVGVGALALGLGGGIGLIAFTEKQGEANAGRTLDVPCVECTGRLVKDCTICEGTGDDPLAKYVAAVRAEVGGEVGDSGPVSASTITVDDWEDGPKQIEMYADILSKFPVKVAENVCANCDGRGVVVCGNCQGSGLQPRFLERYSPDDFMD